MSENQTSKRECLLHITKEKDKVNLSNLICRGDAEGRFLNTEGRKVMKTQNILAVCMIAVTVSFLGFVVENVWLALTKGYMDNRSMCFPFLMGYGLAIVLLFLIFGTPEQPCFFKREIPIKNRRAELLLYFAGVMPCICAGEVILGTFVEKVCHFHWWDYSSIPFHITRYTSIPTSMLFTAGITLFMDRFWGMLYEYYMGWSMERLRITVSVMGLLLIGDFVYSSIRMYRLQGMIRRWRIDTSGRWIYKKIHLCNTGQTHEWP